MRRFYLGLSTTFHDPALALVASDGSIVFAEATERYLQYKRAFNSEPDSTPRMQRLLAELLPDDCELVIATTWSERFSSYLKRNDAAGKFDIERLNKLSNDVNTLLVQPSAERAFLGALHLQQQHAGIGTAYGLLRAFGDIRIPELRRYKHHQTHAALASFGSPFQQATCLVVDGTGESGAVSLFRYADGTLEEVPGSLSRISPGFFFGLVTDLCGFDVLAGEEWKVMGLAPYGRRDPKLADLVRQLYQVEDGRLMRAKPQAVQETLTAILADRPADAPEQGWADLARVGQDTFYELMEVLVTEAYRRAPCDNLVLTGGCALNSSFNGKIARRYGFQRVHVPSAPADDGNALGAALLAWAEDHPGRQPVPGRNPLTPYLGSTVTTRVLDRMRPHEPRLRRVGERVVEETAHLLADGKLVGWVQGRAEFGPRALGNRSILADPRPEGAKDTINAKVKYREAFRPFAPSILAERGPDWFEDFQDSPYMERTLVWKEAVRARVPAVVHADSTGRLQTVTREQNPRFYNLIAAFDRLTGVPVLLNTSFNVMGKPIIHSTEDALMMFYTTGLDALVVDDYLLTK